MLTNVTIFNSIHALALSCHDSDHLQGLSHFSRYNITKSVFKKSTLCVVSEEFTSGWSEFIDLEFLSHETSHTRLCYPEIGVGGKLSFDKCWFCAVKNWILMAEISRRLSFGRWKGSELSLIIAEKSIENIGLPTFTSKQTETSPEKHSENWPLTWNSVNLL